MIWAFHQGWVRVSSSQDSEIFQSSETSWSSKIMAEGTVESSHLMAGSFHESRYRRVYSSGGCTPRSVLPPLREPARIAPRADELQGALWGLVSVDLVSKEHERVRQLFCRLLAQPHRHRVEGIHSEASSISLVAQRVW